MATDEELRKQALHRIGERRAFYMSLAIYVIVNVVLVGVLVPERCRATSGPGGSSSAGASAWRFRASERSSIPDEPSDAEVQREMDKIRGGS